MAQLLAGDTPLTFVDAGLVDYRRAWDWQKELADRRADRAGDDTVLLLQHPDVYTAGSRTQPEDRPTDGTPVIDVDRGGRITWHGPGQLVGYPVVALAEPIDVVRYVRRLESVLIRVCADLGLATERVAGRSGVWLPAVGGRPDRKIAAIGVRVARGVTQHGFALNCDPDLQAFGRIVPCGITDAGVTSLSAELDRDVSVDEAMPLVRRRLEEGLRGTLEADPPPTRTAPPESAATRGRPLRPETPTDSSGGVRWALDDALVRR